MNILVLNGSPKQHGTVATLLHAVVDGASSSADVEWVDVYSLSMRPCIACMKCRATNVCVLPADGAHRVGQQIQSADALVVGTPTHWGNMSTQLKMLFDRNVPVFMGEKPNGMPQARQKGKPAIIVTACSTPWPFNFLAAESRGALHAVREVLHYGGYRLLGTVVKPGSKAHPQISDHLVKKARRLGRKLQTLAWRSAN